MEPQSDDISAAMWDTFKTHIKVSDKASVSSTRALRGTPAPPETPTVGPREAGPHENPSKMIYMTPTCDTLGNLRLAAAHTGRIDMLPQGVRPLAEPPIMAYNTILERQKEIEKFARKRGLWADAFVRGTVELRVEEEVLGEYGGWVRRMRRAAREEGRDEMAGFYKGLERELRVDEEIVVEEMAELELRVSKHGAYPVGLSAAMAIAYVSRPVLPTPSECEDSEEDGGYSKVGGKWFVWGGGRNTEDAKGGVKDVEIETDDESETWFSAVEDDCVQEPALATSGKSHSFESWVRLWLEEVENDLEGKGAFEADCESDTSLPAVQNKAVEGFEETLLEQDTEPWCNLGSCK